MLPEFLSLRADTTEEAVNLLSDLEDVKVLAGGTDLLVRMRKGEAWKHIVDVTAIPGLDAIEQGNGTLVIGSLATHSAVHGNELIRDEALSLSQACGLVGSPQIRNMGTLGGNLANASPAADSMAPLLIHDARVVLESKGASRRVKLKDYIVAPYRTSMRENEMVARIEIKGFRGYREGYTRVARRAAWAISRLSVAWAVKEEDGFFKDVRLAVGSCTPMPFRPREAERFLAGKAKGEGVIREALTMITGEIRRISGGRPSFGYKMPALEGLLDRALRG
jgi:CO/xanthine dehydrogenase FAD-binding subunit